MHLVRALPTCMNSLFMLLLASKRHLDICFFNLLYISPVPSRHGRTSTYVVTSGCKQGVQPGCSKGYDSSARPNLDCSAPFSTSDLQWLQDVMAAELPINFASDAPVSVFVHGGRCVIQGLLVSLACSYHTILAHACALGNVTCERVCS